MKSAPNHQSLLTQRQHAILEHVARHGLATYATIRHKFFAGSCSTAATKLVSRLCQNGYLRRIPILRRQTALVLTPPAARLLGVPLKLCGCPGPQSLPIDWALLHYATAAGSSRQRLTRGEVRSNYPWIPRALATAPYCLDLSTPDQPGLELVRVDLGGKIDHVARKCQVDISRRTPLHGFQELLSKRQFCLVVLTTSTGKADLIRQAIQRHEWPAGLAIRLVAISELGLLLGGKFHAP